MNAQLCSSCSSPIFSESRFCAKCGREVEQTSTEAPALVSAPNGPVPLVSHSPGQIVGGGVAPVAPSVTVNVAAAAPQNTVVVLDNNSGPGFGTRVIWFLFIGWWLTFWWIGIAWLLNATIIGLPLGLMMINRIPKVLTLRPDRQQTTVVQTGNTTIVSRTGVAQLSMWIRAVYFLLVGWWVSLLWAYLAWFLCIIIITLPIGLVMFNFLPQVTTLRRN